MLESCEFKSGSKTVELVQNRKVVEIFTKFVNIRDSIVNNEISFDFNVFQIGHEKSGRVIFLLENYYDYKYQQKLVAFTILYNVHRNKTRHWRF